MQNDNIAQEIFGSKDLGEAWLEWKEYRKEQHNFKYKPIGEKKALSRLKKLTRSVDEAIELIELAMANGWRGIYKPKNYEQKKSNTESQSSLVDALKRRGIFN